MSSLVDFHCHLDLYPDYPAVLEETERSGVRTLSVTTTPRAWPRNRELTKGMRYVRPALGFHPQLVGDDTRSELALWDRFLPEARYIGEVGLDAGQEFFSTLDQQRQVFQHILSACATAGDKVISVHAVRAVGSVLDMIEAALPPERGRVVLHWFTGTPSQARRAVRLGCYFSINTPMLYGGRGRNIIEVLPLDRLITETDGPFTLVNQQPSRPADVARCIELLSKILGETSVATSNKVVANLENLLSGAS